MTTSDEFARARHELARQLAQHGIRSASVLRTMERVPRERFMPEGAKHLAYADRAVPIGCGQTISQPYIVALMTEVLQLTGVERVLEIGTGSGYQTAILAELAGGVVSVELHEKLSLGAAAALVECGYGNVTLVVGDGTHGWPALAPYDRILVAACAANVPPALADQLVEGGILVIPIGPTDGQELQAFRKTRGRLISQWLTGCRFVPLVGAEEPPP